MVWEEFLKCCFVCFKGYEYSDNSDCFGYFVWFWGFEVIKILLDFVKCYGGYSGCYLKLRIGVEI